MGERDVVRYDQKWPGVDISPAQKEERMQREDFKDELRSHSRTNRNRGVVFTMSNPWLESVGRR